MNDAVHIMTPGLRVLAVTLAALSLVPIWATEYFPSQNGPWHLLTIHMMREYQNPAFDYARYYVPAWHAIPHLLHTLVVYAVSFVVPVLTAHKVVISLYAVGLPASVFWFLSRVAPSKMAYGFASFLLVFNLPLLRGYHDYTLGIPLVVAALAVWYPYRHALTAGRRLGLTLLVVLIYLSHLFNLLVFGLLVLVLSAPDRGRGMRRVMTLAPSFVPSLILLADFAWFHVTHSSWMVASELEFFAPHRAIPNFFERFFHTVSSVAWPIATVPWVLICSFVAKAAYDGVRRTTTSAHETATRLDPWLAASLALVTAYFVFPYKILGWHYVNVRLVPYVLIVACAAAPVWSSRRLRLGFVALTAISAVAVFALTAAGFRDTDRDLKEYVSGMAKAERNRLWLPMSFEMSKVGTVYHTSRAHEYYVLSLGGANGKGIARFDTVTPLRYRWPIEEGRFPNWDRTEPASSMRRIAETYDYVLVWGRNLEFEGRLSAASFVEIHRHGRVAIYAHPMRVGAARALP